LRSDRKENWSRLLCKREYDEGRKLEIQKRRRGGDAGLEGRAEVKRKGFKAQNGRGVKD